MMAEQFRRRLMSMASDGGYAVFHADKEMMFTNYAEYLQVAGPDFNLVNIREIKVNDAPVDKSRVVKMTLLNDNVVVVRYGGIRSLKNAFGRSGVKATDDGYAGTVYGLRIVDVSHIDTSRVTTMEDLFMHSNAEKIIGLDRLDYGRVSDMSAMFWQMGSAELTSIDFGSADLSSVKTMKQMFGMNSDLTEVTMAGPINPDVDTTDMFVDVTTTGLFRYNPEYDYSRIISVLPATWTAQPITEE